MKISSYADDTTIFLDGSRKSIASNFEILDSFRSASGLKVNYNKSEAMKLGPLKLCKDIQPIGRGPSWTNGPIRVFGYSFNS